MTTNSATVSESILAFGPTHFYRAVAIPLASDIETLAREYPAAEIEGQWQFYVRPNHQASGLELAGFVGVIAFIGGWAAEKALDELYSSKLGPLLRSKISVCFKPDASHKRYGVSLVINKSPERTSIMIACIGRDLSEIERSEKQMGSVISMALQTASRTETPGEIHLYIIEDGAANQHPWVYSDISEAMQHLRGMSAIKPPSFIRNGS